jgi:hypothetical protein
MTPKEKAEDLVKKFFEFNHRFKWDSDSDEWTHDYYLAKECALIAVNEIINANPHSNPLNTDVYSTMEWWQEVKKEIEKL